MVLISAKDCYIFTLTDEERLTVHSDDGIAKLEVI